jgi:CheY-like chemotaxis protein
MLKGFRGNSSRTNLSPDSQRRKAVNQFDKVILSVDYDSDNSEVLKLLLNQKGFMVEISETASEALALVRQKPFSLVLSEFRLPDMCGAEFCRKFREFDCQTPFVFFSASVEAKQKAQGLSVGAQAYLFKPNDIDKVAETIGSLILKKPQFI